MANSDESGEYSPTDDDAKQILEFLRGQVRAFGFAEADLALQDLLREMGVPDGMSALAQYFQGLDGYLRIFRAEQMTATTEMLTSRLDGSFQWWRLVRGGDSERPTYFGDPNSVLVEDLRSYSGVESLYSDLRGLMNQLGISVPTNGDDDSAQPQRERPQ